MKKDFIFTSLLLTFGALLFMLKAVGMTAHIVVSILGIAVLIAYTVTTKKDWKIPALEVITRAFYGIAIITGIIILNVHGIVALSIIHKASATLFLIGLVVLFVQKLLAQKEQKN